MLRAIMLKKKISEKKTALEALRKAAESFSVREAELEQAINEAETEEEKQAVEDAVTEFETDKSSNEEQINKLSSEISNLEKELTETERKVNTPTPPEKSHQGEERKESRNMDIRTKFYGMTVRERDEFFRRDDVKRYLENVRRCMQEKRAVNNVDLTIPEIMLPLLKEKVEQTSKLLGKVSLSRVTGTSRQIIQGTIPEAIWTEMCGKLNELEFGFNEIEIDGYKVGGFYELCNATIEDSDIDLTSEILNSLGTSIAKALDKAIVYGKGTKMPLGIVTRLAQTSKPSDYPEDAREWKDLHTSNIKTGGGVTGVNLFKEIATATLDITNDYFDDDIIWLMNRKTHTKLLINSMDKNANAAIVAGINTTMPVIGGEIIDLPFIPDDNIVFGYGEAYRLVERGGQKFASSEHVKFIEDRTVFKGTARYDGKPAIAEAFGVLSISSTAPVTSVAFPQDKANEASADSSDNDSNA